MRKTLCVSVFIETKAKFLLKQIWKMKMRHILINRKLTNTIYLVRIVRDNIVHFSFK